MYILSFCYKFFLRIFVFLLFFLSYLPNLAFAETPTERLFKYFKSYSTEQRLKLVDSFFVESLNYKREYCLNRLENLIKIAKDNNDVEIIVVLLNSYSTKFQPQKSLQIANQAYNYALRINNKRLMGDCEICKFEYYRLKQNYDSSISCLLHAKELFEAENNIEKLVDVYHCLGNTYFDVLALDKAKSCFQTVRLLKGNLYGWKIWRELVISNNFGLIDIRSGEYNSALSHFYQSIEILKRNTQGTYTNLNYLQLAYIYSKMCEIYYKMGDIKNAVLYFDIAEKNNIYSKQTELIPQLLILKAKIYFSRNEYKPALETLNNAELNLSKSSIESLIEIFDYRAKVYEKLGDIKSSLIAKNRYYVLHDSLNNSRKTTAILQTIAEHNYEKYKSGIEVLRREKIYLISFSAIILIFLGTLIRALLLLRTKNKVLIEKNRKLATLTFETSSDTQNDNQISFNLDLSSNQNQDNNQVLLQTDLDSDLNSEQNRDIILQLQKILNKNKKYCNSDITLDSLANEINVHRVYLSKAINSYLKMNFNAYINELRINEAIRIISNNELPNYTLEGISETVGFKNRTSFITAFKKHTGVTPSLFIKQANSTIQ